MKRCGVLTASLFLLCAAAVFAGTSFDAPQINKTNDVLFTITHNQPGEISYSSLALANVATDAPPRLLTCFPEKLETLQGGAVLQMRNRYGTVRYSFSTNSPTPLIVNDALPQNPVRLGEMAVSPDGKWLCFIKKTAAAHGSLILRSTSESAGLSDIVLAENIDFSFTRVPVKWSPDSAVLVYEHGGKLLFLRTADVERKTILDEQYRTIGRGLITSVSWASAKNLIYIDKDLVYSIPTLELYTRALYASFVGIGGLIARLSGVFNPATDMFWVNNNASSIVVFYDKRTLVCFNPPGRPVTSFSSDGMSFTASLIQYAMGVVPEPVSGADVFWDSAGQPLIWFESARNGIPRSLGGEQRFPTGTLYKLSESTFFKVYSADNLLSPRLSPDEKNIAFIADGNAVVFNIERNAITARLQGETVVSLAWRNNTELAVGGTLSTRLWNPGTNTNRLLHLSAADN
jgi:hypothetical protein